MKKLCSYRSGGHGPRCGRIATHPKKAPDMCRGHHREHATMSIDTASEIRRAEARSMGMNDWETAHYVRFGSHVHDDDGWHS